VAAKRGKSQAKRNSGNSNALPGWAWMVLGILLAVVVILVAPKYLKSDGDGFFRPQPNPDARPAPVASSDDEGVVSGDDDSGPAKRRDDAAPAKKDTDYDFYTLLPGKEVPMSDAELAASERAEAQRQARAESRPKPETKPAQTGDTAAATATPLPKPVEAPPPSALTADNSAAEPAKADKQDKPAATATASTPVDDGTRYLLQAGAFQASGQAEEMKARIAMLGLGARVESASIGGKTVYRVRMGPYGTASDLADAKRKLSSGGLSAMAIKVK
jgi:cell division protein FtsN